MGVLIDRVNDLINIIIKIFLYIYHVVVNLTGEQIALISVFISFIIYMLGKQSELNLKKYEAKKQQYIKLIALLEKIYSQNIPTDKNGNPKLTQAMKSDFFDLGSSLLLYGSKKLYKQYIFYREFSSNLLILNSKYYDEGIIIYLMADMLTTIRKEVGLNKLDSISTNESLAFFVNDIANNPISKIKSYNINYKIKMIKLELFFIDRFKFVYTRRIYNRTIRPIFGAIYLLIKYLVIFPIIKIFTKIFPNFTDKLEYFDFGDSKKKKNKETKET